MRQYGLSNTLTTQVVAGLSAGRSAKVNRQILNP